VNDSTSVGRALTIPRRRFFARLLALAAGATVLGRARRSSAASQAITPYLGEIALISFNFPPKGWAFCNGQLLPINQNQALFNLLGTTYGGNGATNFALPDLRGVVPIHQGQGPGLSPRALGSRGGEPAHTVVLGELPSHAHVARGSSVAGTATLPSATLVPARNPAQIPQWGANADTVMSTGAIASSGQSQPHDNMQPYLVLNYVMALQGFFPSP
jgi:microcystin-dependent protein